MSNRAIQDRSFGMGGQGDIVEIWRQAVLGNAAARRFMLRRIMPASEIGGLAPVITIDALVAGRQPDRAAA
jgi:hypothetical protein